MAVTIARNPESSKELLELIATSRGPSAAPFLQQQRRRPWCPTKISGTGTRPPAITPPVRRHSTHSGMGILPPQQLLRLESSAPSQVQSSGCTSWSWTTRANGADPIKQLEQPALLLHRTRHVPSTQLKWTPILLCCLSSGSVLTLEKGFQCWDGATRKRGWMQPGSIRPMPPLLHGEWITSWWLLHTCERISKRKVSKQKLDQISWGSPTQGVGKQKLASDSEFFSSWTSSTELSQKSQKQNRKGF